MKKILAIEPDAEVAGLIESRLSARGYEVRLAFSEEEGLAALSRLEPDLVLLSSKLEKVGQDTLSLRIRKTPFGSYIPILLLAEQTELAALLLAVERGYDDFLVKPFDPFVLQLRVALALRRRAEQVQANPLTRLPGNLAIDQAVRERLAKDEAFSVCHLDLDNFKAFNDLYGYDRGDDVIRQTAHVLLRALADVKAEGSFVGHVGGDDFVVVVDPEHEEAFAHRVLDVFDRMVLTYYSEEDRARGRVYVVNRKGKEEEFPLMSISIAAVVCERGRFASPAEVSRAAAEVKKFLKAQPGSHYLRDRRNQPVRSLEEAAKVLRVSAPPRRPRAREELLGQMLLREGLLDERSLQAALDHHFSSGRPLGEVLVSLGLVPRQTMGKMLERKLGVPFVSLKDVSIAKDVAELFTPDYRRSHRVMPLRFEEDELHVAMVDPFDFRTIEDIETASSLRVRAYLCLEQDFLEAALAKEREGSSAFLMPPAREVEGESA